MSGDNPFAEPDDSDRTVIKPNPGGRRSPGPAPSAPASGFEAAPIGTATAIAPPSGPDGFAMPGDPVRSAATPILLLIARLRNTASQPDPAELRERAVQAMQQFEQTVRAASGPADQLRAAHYALCAALDDVVLSTPWGSQSVWATSSIVSTFHKEVRSGERFFDLLNQIRQNPSVFLPVLEIMYLCLSLGYQGRYRLSPRGPAELETLREDLYQLIGRVRGHYDPALSGAWQGVAAPYQPSRSRVPLWVAGVAGFALVALLYVWLATDLNARSDEVFDRAVAIPPVGMPTIVRGGPVDPPASLPGAIDRLKTFLKPEIDQGLVAVVGTEATPIVRIQNHGMFPSGSATLQPSFFPLLQRIGVALKEERGPVTVIGYTDNQPIRTVQFPSNFQLSAARAKAALAVVGQTIDNSSRLSAQGLAESNPLASNATPEGRDQNRRIEVVLSRQG